MKAILVNSFAGQGKIMADWERRERDIRLAIGDVAARVEFTTEADHGAGIARRLAQDGVEEIVVVGGDGTLVQVFAGLMSPELESARKKVLVSLMPAGRGNDFFRATVGRHWSDVVSSMRWERALENLRLGEPRWVDLCEWSAGSARETWMNVASFGFPGLVVAKVVQGAAAGAKDGSWTYVLRSIESFGPYRPIEFAVSVDGKEVYSGPVFSGFVLNGHCNAGGVRWSNTANPFDGELEVLIQEPKSTLGNVQGAPRLAYAMTTGDWDGVTGTHRFRGKRVEVRRLSEAAHPVFEIDGEQTDAMRAGESAGLTFTVMPKAIRFRATPPSP